ncbi:MAG: phosphoglycerate dehydrogenase [Rhodospirillales bacterium]
MAKVLITCHHLLRHIDRYRPRFEAAGVELVLPAAVGQQFSSREMQDMIQGVTTCILGDDVVDRPVLEAGKESGLQAIIKWGIGTDSIDKESAADLGIPVKNTPGTFSDEVADAAFALILMLTRGYHRMNASVAEGGWLKVQGRSLAGKTLGVVGLGGIGRAIGRRGTAFGMTVIGSDPVELPSDLLAEHKIDQKPFETVLEQADFLTVACNLTPDNHHLIAAESLARMKAGASLINVARGPLVKEVDLVAALKSGHLAAAALDVFEVEPLPADSPLRDLDNVVFGTHNGSNTEEGVERVNEMTVAMALEVVGAGK